MAPVTLVVLGLSSVLSLALGVGLLIRGDWFKFRSSYRGDDKNSRAVLFQVRLGWILALIGSCGSGVVIFSMFGLLWGVIAVPASFAAVFILGCIVGAKWIHPKIEQLCSEVMSRN